MHSEAHIHTDLENTSGGETDIIRGGKSIKRQIQYMMVWDVMTAAEKGKECSKKTDTTTINVETTVLTVYGMGDQ